MRFLLVLLSCVAVALAAERSYEGFKVYSVQLKSAEQLEAFVGLQKYGIDAWDSPNKANKPFRVMVAPNMIQTFESFLGDHDIFADIIMDDAQKTLDFEKKRNAAIPKFRKIGGRHSVDFDHYFRFEEFEHFLEETAEEFPNLVQLESVGKSAEGRDLWLIKISTTGFDGSKPVIFMDANIHAREWIAGMTSLYLIHQLTDHAADYPEMLNVDWMIMPMANPDGYEYSHTNDRMWRKNRSPNAGSTCPGTDPNRNFAHMWHLAISTSDAPCSILYRGPHAESELEVQAVSNLLRAHSNDIKLYLAVHSYGDYLLYPYGYATGVSHPNQATLESVGSRAAAAIRGVNSARVYTVGNSGDALYPASGASDDFAAGVAGIPYAYTVELSGGGSQGFDLPPAQITPVSREIFAAYREYAMWVAESN